MSTRTGPTERCNTTRVQNGSIAPYISSLLYSNAMFTRYIGIDYSGAATAESSLKGLRVCVSEGGAEPIEILPPPSPKKYWTRRGVAEWLIARLSEDVPAVVGIDHGFSFPLTYFEQHKLPRNWPAFLDDFQKHWPTDGDYVCVEFIREGMIGNGQARMGNARWRRLTEQRSKGAKSVFHFDVQGSVAKSTHAGLPWLRAIKQQCPNVHFWPFDGWDFGPGVTVVAEAYPSMMRTSPCPDDLTGDQHDAYSIAAWLARADREGTLAAFLKPELTEAERAVAEIEGWILGVG
jgi:hypothetical protein